MRGIEDDVVEAGSGRWLPKKLTRLLLCPGSDDPQSAAASAGSGRNRAQHGGNDEAAHEHSRSNGALSGAAARPRTPGQNRTVEDERQAAKMFATLGLERYRTS